MRRVCRSSRERQSAGARPTDSRSFFSGRLAISPRAGRVYVYRISSCCLRTSIASTICRSVQYSFMVSCRPLDGLSASWLFASCCPFVVDSTTLTVCFASSHLVDVKTRWHFCYFFSSRPSTRASQSTCLLQGDPPSLLIAIMAVCVLFLRFLGSSPSNDLIWLFRTSFKVLLGAVCLVMSVFSGVLSW